MTPPTDPTRWPKVKQLFEAALDLPPAEREGFLFDACRTPDGALDDDLLASVRVLLDADAEAETEDDSGFLGTPALSLQSLLDGLGVEIVGREEGPGVRVGPYRLLRLLGRGGMGEVYLAERADGLFERTVALKRVRADLAPSVAARFTAERQILADLVHPGIARLYGAGTDDDGRPWLAMEPVDGVPIATFAEARGLPRSERVGLMLQVCGAVQHAHQRLVVHRDLKPSNVLVVDGSGGPQVRLLDFGIAQILGADGDGLLTRAYASPEQLRGEPATTASDVYGLGGLLVETLTGNRPPGPGRAPGLDGDLAAIAKKALAEAPTDRYASAEALADDLRRWLDGRPVLAHPPSLVYRTRRFLARHRVPVAIAGVALALVALAGTAAGLRVMDERDRAQQAAADAEAVAEAQNEILRVLEPSFVASLDTSASADTPTVTEVVEQTVEAVEETYADNPAVLARSLVTLASTLYERGQPRRADSLFTRALALRRPLSREADPVVHAALIGRGLVADLLNDRPAARRFFREALAMEREHPALTDDSSTELLLATVTDDDTARERELLRVLAERRQSGEAVPLAQAHNALGVHYQNEQDYRSAYAEYTAAERIVRQTLGELHPNTILLRSNLSYASAAMGHYDEAIRHARTALDNARLAGLGPIREANLLQALGQAHYFHHDYAAASARLREGLVLYDREMGPDSPQALGIVNSLVVVMSAHRDYEAALRYQRRVHDANRRRGALRGAGGIYSRQMLASLAYALGDRESALAELRQLAREARTITDNSNYRATTLGNAGSALLDSGDARAAEPLLREALALQREARPETSAYVQSARFVYGWALAELGRMGEARPHLLAARGHDLQFSLPFPIDDVDAKIDRLLARR